jgi:uncharacterized membrane-anchored protein
MSETKQPCYDIDVRFAGIRKRCRKVEAHHVKLAESIEPTSIMMNGEISGPTLVDLIDQAKKTIAQGYKIPTPRAQVTINFRFVKKSVEYTDGVAFRCCEFQPFGAGHFSHTFTIEAEA